MKVELFDFDLPQDLIATRPAVPRDAARMLVVADTLHDATVAELPSFLRAGDLLVANDTRVLPAQLTARRGNARIELTLHKRLGALQWAAFARPARKLKAGDRLTFAAGLAADVCSREGPEVRLRFDCADEAALMARLDAVGTMPLPPYIRKLRDVDARDRLDYQTIYAGETGAVAAPTAGLHFTETLFAKLANAGIDTVFLTLHVGAGTFLPVVAEDTAAHRMHSEWGRISKAAAARINQAHAAGGRIVAVGTTAARLLESAADADGRVAPFEGETDIFITPGYEFRSLDALVTNFHLPRSTLFMLVAALCGLTPMQAAYRHAIRERYRFYSYGDCALLFAVRP